MKHDEHELIDMKLSAGDRGRDVPMSVGKAPDYFYGLNLRLENAELKKLALKRLPQVGDEYTIYAVGKVVNVYESQSENNREDRAVQIQIQKLALK